MIHFNENRISREDLLSLLGSTLDAIGYIKKDQANKISSFRNEVVGKSFTLYRDSKFFSKKKIEVDMTEELFLEIISHDGIDSYIKNHTKQYERLYNDFNEKYKYYSALINTTFHVEFSEFSYYMRISNEVMKYDISELGKMLVMRFCGEKYIEMRSYNYFNS